MDAKGLLNSLDNQESEQIIDAIPGIVAEHDTELPDHLGGIAIVESLASEIVVKPTEAPVDVLSLLSPEQVERAKLGAVALAEKFGLESKDFSVLRTKDAENGEDTFFVVLTTDEGIDLGNPYKTYDKKRSWDSIAPEKPNKQFEIEIDGKTVDTRTAVTFELLHEVTKTNPNTREWVWETGSPEKADVSRASIVCLTFHYAFLSRLPRDIAYDDIRFRPAIAL